MCFVKERRLLFYGLLILQVPSLGWDALMVAVVPLEVGKPTVKSEKASVHGGICRWEKPIYETVRFVQEPKTGKINEKIYHFHVSTVGNDYFLQSLNF